MAEKLSAYRVTAAMDASAYAAGMAQKVAADKAGAASAAQVGAAVTSTQTKVSQAGDVLTRLSRSYVDGFSQAERFTRAVNTLGRGMETGNVSMERAEVILEGIQRKFGMTANAADLAEQGHYQLAAAVTASNAKLAANDNALDLNSAAQLRNANAVKMSANQRTNLMFQLQDIGVSLAGGMNPLMVLTQQLPQIAMIFEGGLMGALRATITLAGEAAVAFAPIGIAIAAVATIFAAFTTEINRGQKQQVGFFDVVVAGWELATEAIGRAIEPVVSWFGWLWDQASPIIADIGVLLIQTFDLAFRNIGTIFGQLPNLLGDLTISTAQAVIDGVEWMVNKSIEAINVLTSGARDVLKFVGIETGDIGPVELGTLDNKWKGSMGNLPGQLAQNLQDVKGTDYLGALGDRSREVANRPSDKEAKKAADDAAKEADRQRKAYADLMLSSEQFIAEKQREAEALGMSTEAAAKMRYEQEMLNKAANDNIKLSPTQRAEIEQTAAAMAAAEERTRQLTEAYEFGKSTLGSFFSDFKSELMNGTSLWGAFASAGANALQTIADKALSMAAEGIWDMIFGALKSTIFGGMPTASSLGQTGMYGWEFLANGGVKSGPGIGAYSNQIVDRPTVFPFAKGIGLMGEAGAEAIMPLRRGPDGRLGVTAANSNRPNAANDDIRIRVEVSVRDDGKLAMIARQEGGRAANVIIDQKVPGMIKSQAPAAVTAYQRNGGV